MKAGRIAVDEASAMPEMASGNWGWACVYGAFMLLGGVLGYFLRVRIFPGTSDWAIGLTIGVFIGLALTAARMWFGWRQVQRVGTQRSA